MERNEERKKRLLERNLLEILQIYSLESYEAITNMKLMMNKVLRIDERRKVEKFY